MAQSPVVIEQRITVGSQFNELAPTTVPADTDAIRKFPTDVQGGLFEFNFAGPDASFVTYQIDQIFVDFGDAGTSEVAIINSDGTPVRIILASPGAGTYLRVEPFLLAWDEKLTLKTTLASVALYARIMASPVRIKE